MVRCLDSVEDKGREFSLCFSVSQAGYCVFVPMVYRSDSLVSPVTLPLPFPAGFPISAFALDAGGGDCYKLGAHRSTKLG